MSRLQHPGIVFWWPYVISAFAVMFGFLVLVTGESWRSALHTMLARKVWLTRSTLVDVTLSAGYALLLATPAAAWQTSVFRVVSAALGDLPELPWSLALPAAAEALIVSVYAMLWIDFATYVAHVAMHKLPLLWPLHAVHHAATELTLFTTHRQHPLEPFLLNTARGASAAVGMTLFYRVFPQLTPPATVLGVGAGFFVYMFTVNLQHSHVPVRYPRWLGRLVLSPHVHHLHHSRAPEHRDCNFGVIFPYWDRLFGTYRDEAPGELRFGLAPEEDPFGQSIVRCLTYPILRR